MNKTEGITRMTSLNQDMLMSQKTCECQHIRTLGSLDVTEDQQNNNNIINKPAYSMEVLPFVRTQHQLVQANSPQNQRTNKDDHALQICQIKQESSDSSSGSSSVRSSDMDSFSEKVASVPQLNSPYQSKPFIDEKWNPLGWVKESLQKPISKNKTEAKVQYFISSNNDHKRKHRLLSLHTAESGAFKELVTFIDKVDKLEEVNLHKLIRKQSCCCEGCGQKTKKQKKIDMVLPQFKPKQAIRRMHRKNFQKIITDVNKISQFFRSKLQLHQKNPINYQGIRGKSNSSSKMQHSNTIKMSSRSPLRRSSFSREGGQSSHHEPGGQRQTPLSADIFQTSPLEHFKRDLKAHFTTFKPRESLKSQSHTFHTNFSLQVSPDTPIQTLIQPIMPDKRISNFSPEMIRSQKSQKSRFIPTQFASRSSKCSQEPQDQQQKKQIPERSKLETAIMKQFKEETNMKHINTDFVMSVGNNILKESLQNLPKDGDEEPSSFPEIPAINTEPIAEDIKDDVLMMPSLSQKNKIPSFKNIYASNNNISNYCKGNAPKLKTCFLYPLIKTKQEQYPLPSFSNNISDPLVAKHTRVKSDISYKNHLTTSQTEFEEDKPNIQKKLLKKNKKHKHNQSTSSIIDHDSSTQTQPTSDKNLSNQSSQSSTWKFYSPAHARNPISSFNLAAAGNSFIENLAQKVNKTKKKQNLPSITSCSMIDNIYLRTAQFPQPNPSCSKKNASNNRPPFTTFGINNQMLPSNTASPAKLTKIETIIPTPKRLKKDLSLSYFISATQSSNYSSKAVLKKTFQIPKIPQSLANQFSNIYFSKTNLFQNKSVYQAASSASNQTSPLISSKLSQN